jgi:phytoene dehydrogenase-like protein
MAEEPAQRGPFDAERLAGRVDEYRQLWERAAHRLVHEEYHAEDLVDDWFTLVGKVVRDTTALAAMSWQAGSEQARRQAARTQDNGDAPPATGGVDGG